MVEAGAATFISVYGIQTGLGASAKVSVDVFKERWQVATGSLEMQAKNEYLIIFKQLFVK